MSKNVFEWDKGLYTIHVDAMDSEHEKLIEIMNRLAVENDKGALKAVLLRTIDELVAYTRGHFAREEAYFDTIPNYNLKGPHKLIHQSLLKDLAGHLDKYKNSKEDRVPADFFLFLKVWLKAHICGIDRKYGELVKVG